MTTENTNTMPEEQPQDAPQKVTLQYLLDGLERYNAGPFEEWATPAQPVPTRCNLGHHRGPIYLMSTKGPCDDPQHNNQLSEGEERVSPDTTQGSPVIDPRSHLSSEEFEEWFSNPFLWKYRRPIATSPSEVMEEQQATPTENIDTCSG